MRRHIGWIVLGVLVAGCGSATPPTPTSPAVASGAAIQLNQAPADLGCDTIGVDYREVTFRIDPAEAEQVAALADTGQLLRNVLVCRLPWELGRREGRCSIPRAPSWPPMARPWPFPRVPSRASTATSFARPRMRSTS